MESNSLSRRAGLEEKIPELERTVGMIELLLAKEVRLGFFSSPCSSLSSFFTDALHSLIRVVLYCIDGGANRQHKNPF